VTVETDGFIWREKTYPSRSMIARKITGTELQQQLKKALGVRDSN
jgi:hypothetical protein